MKLFSNSLLSIFVLWPILVTQAAPQQGWRIEQQGTGFSHDTSTGISERKGIRRQNLISVSKQGENLLESYWEEGAFRATVTYNGEKIVDGFDIADVSRIKSFRFDKKGSTVYIRTTKGPKAIVELIQNGHPVLSWPRLSLVNILSYRKDKMIVSIYIDKTQRTEFWQYSRNNTGDIEKTGKMIGALAGCSLLSSKVTKTGIAMAAYCHPKRGSDIKFLEFETGEIIDIRATEADELLAYSWADYDKDTIPVLSISGNSNGRQFFHAVSGSLLSYLGEPMSVASDESGKQSWSQSYRTRTLAELYRKSGHPAFKELAIRAMKNILRQTNGSRGISGEFNPTEGWASRIYSKDGKSPISFMINQAMISSSLIKSCQSLGDSCPPNLRKSIDQNAEQLVAAYEQWYDIDKRLYRIPYGTNFRFDGIWAPWNWHMMWAPVLQHVGQISENAELVTRAERLAKKFVSSWETVGSENPTALWRYWPEPYYKGWAKTDNISTSRPTQKPRNMVTERYEDINHAGISLLGLSDINHRFSPEINQATEQTLQNLLNQTPFLARDLDGNGPVSPKWLPGAGWHLFDGRDLQGFYARKLPGSVSSDQHLMYALLYNPEKSFHLKLSLLQCSDGNCLTSQNWFYQTVTEFLGYNPLFTLSVVTLTY